MTATNGKLPDTAPLKMMSKKIKQRPRARETFEEPPLFEAVFAYIGYGLLAIIGYVCDFLRLIGVKEGHRLKNVSFGVAS